MKTKKRLMLALPEVAHLVERIPVARIKLKASAVHLRFMQHARDTRMPLKKQCEYLGIPWHARKIPAHLVSRQSLEAASCLSSSDFAQWFPYDGTLDEVNRWSEKVKEADNFNMKPPIRRWVAVHALSEDYHGRFHNYLASLDDIPLQTTVSRVKERAAATRVSITADQFHIMVGDSSFFAFPNGGLVGNFDLDRNPVDYGDIPIDLDVDGYRFHLLSKTEEFEEEGRVMRNCVSAGARITSGRQVTVDFFTRAKAGLCHIVSIRDADGARLATMKVGSRWSSINTIELPGNEKLRDFDMAKSAVEYRRKIRAIVEPDEVHQTSAIDEAKAVQNEHQSASGVFNSFVRTLLDNSAHEILNIRENDLPSAQDLDGDS